MKRQRADFLLIDISNSFTKLAFASQERIGRSNRIATARLRAAGVRKMLHQQDVAMIVVSSVVPLKNREIGRAAGGHKVIWLTAKARLNLRFDYPNPQRLGADRLANAVAAVHLYGTPAIVIDFGTAVTFDVISADRAYLGGVIAPGIEAMTNFLYDRTALLPPIVLDKPARAVGKSTREAMQAGAVFGYRGLVREILRSIQREEFSRKRVHIIATGGYAKLMARGLPELRIVHENLTLEGLRLVGRMNAQ